MLVDNFYNACVYFRRIFPGLLPAGTRGVVAPAAAGGIAGGAGTVLEALDADAHGVLVLW